MGRFDMNLGEISRHLGIYLSMVRQDLQNMPHRYQLCVELRGGYVEDVGAKQEYRTRAENNFANHY